MTFGKKQLAAGFLAATFLLIQAVSSADAALTMRIQDKGVAGAVQVLTDVGNTGSLIFSGVVGRFNVRTAAGNSVKGGFSVGNLNLNLFASRTLASPNTGDLVVWIADSGYGPDVVSGLTGTLSGTVGSTANSPARLLAQSWGNLNNLVPDLTFSEPAIPSGSVQVWPGAGIQVSPVVFTAGPTTVPFAPVDQFSLFAKIVVSNLPNGQSVFANETQDVAPIPEPTSLSIFALGLAGVLGAVAAKRRRS